MGKALTDLIRISNSAGNDPSFVQGGGGNTSIKTDDGKYMYIKASGTVLKEMNSKKGWRRMNLGSVLLVMQDKSIAKLPVHVREPEVANRLLLACDDNITDGSRPSVEVLLHASLGKCVVHIHPSAVGAYVNAKDGKAKLERLFKDLSKPFLWVPYADSGYAVARKIMTLTAKYEEEYGVKPQVIFLEKHGLFVSTSSPNSSLRLTKKIITKCNLRLKRPAAMKAKSVEKPDIQQAALCIRKAFYDACGEYASVSYFTNDTIASFVRKKGSKRLLRGVLSPQELLYSNGSAEWLEKLDAKKITARIRSLIGKGQKIPAAYLVKGMGLFAVGKKKTAITVRDIVTSSLFIRTNADRLGGVSVLNKKQRDFINKWESGALVKTIAAGANPGDLEGRVAVVTGAGSGLGKSIALALADAGALVAIADIDEKAALQVQKDIESRIADSHTVVIKCNVTDERSVEAGFRKIIGELGGLDILVNAAGVAPAGPLVDMDVDKWRFALEVNLTGYFLMAKCAARIMIQQGMGGNIINLSSKSGLEASKNNTPYNATKAGQVHMGRGWAMELGQFGIRVNSLCPGNVFEGSKIWNPEYIKICAKKYRIKPEEVIPYYVSKTILNKEIKGRDIANGVVFLASDKSRMITGQTLVVDGGQVMVR